MKFAPHEGMAYRLYTTELWAEEHENKFMGEGTEVDFKTWQHSNVAGAGT